MVDWLTADDVLFLHAEQIRLYGGAPGLLNPGALHSTLARPQNLASYAAPDIFDLTASNAFGFAKNHCFVDGNKRIALASAAVFLLDHHFLFVAPTDEVAAKIEGVAQGSVSEAELAIWLRQKSLPLPDGEF